MFPWGGITCCLSAAALYLLGRSSGKDADILKSVYRIGQLKDLVFTVQSLRFSLKFLNFPLFFKVSVPFPFVNLKLLDYHRYANNWFCSHFSAKILDTACKVLPLVVTVSGRVGSDAPIKCDSGLRGVIVEETAEQHFLKHNDSGSWVEDSALMLAMSKEVPWYLDDGTGRVHVVGARGANGLVLAIGREIFEESGRSLVRGTLDYLQGLKMLGVKRVERVLPIGTSLTVVGEAVKDDIGTIRIQRPHKGPFYVSPKSIDQLIANLGIWSRFYKYASMGFTVVGVFLIAKHTIRYIMERRRRYDLQLRVLAAAAQRLEQDHDGSDEKADNGLESAKKERLMPDLCVICLEHEYNAVFVP
ncbi:hypothetical protein IFM89_032403 [Coptis chinensis]|uniref:RING-type E3 ubiquitin transferase n=1 Tax=Coptis chinensis TaxID=261450 RepID=A0A835M1E2_9MAGN|nr:hypothetical protein IFM89_032403 [Coptis chinensis]